MKRILLAGLLGGIVVYAWGAISWALMPWHSATLADLPNDTAVTSVLRASAMPTGVYTFPRVPTDAQFEKMTQAEQEAWSREYQSGPVGLIVYFERGNDPWSPAPFIAGFVLYVVTATLAAYLLSLAVPSISGYWRGVLFVWLLGVFATLTSHVAQWNWTFEPTGYAMAGSLDLLIGWALAGTIIAWRMRLPMRSGSGATATAASSSR